MNDKDIAGIGTFKRHEDYWECFESLLDGISVSVMSLSIGVEVEAQLRRIAADWETYLNMSHAFIADKKAEYDLRADSFTSPSIIIGDDGWTVFFETDDNIDSVVGVEYYGETPRQLIIGD
jgi:hypothetical protein